MISNQVPSTNPRQRLQSARQNFTVLRPCYLSGYPRGLAAEYEAEAIADFVATRVPGFLQNGDYRYIVSVTWAPKDPIDDDVDYAAALRSALRRHVGVGDLVIQHESGRVWIADDTTTLQPCTQAFATLAGYPEAAHLDDIGRATVLSYGSYDDLKAVLEAIIPAWSRRDATALGYGRPLRLTMKNVSDLIITILFQDEENRRDDRPRKTLPTMLTRIRLPGNGD